MRQRTLSMRLRSERIRSGKLDSTQSHGLVKHNLDLVAVAGMNLHY